MWFYTLIVIQLVSIATVRGNGNGWGNPNNSPGSAPTQQAEYWWKNSGAFQKPANHPGIAPAADNNNLQSGGGQGWGAPASVPQTSYQQQKPVQSYNPPNPPRQTAPAPVQSYNPPVHSYNPPVPVPIPAPVPAPVPVPSYQNYESASVPAIDPNCMLTSKKDCHVQTINISPPSSYSQPKPIAPVPVPVPVHTYNEPIPIPQSPVLVQKPNNPPAASNYNSYGISVPTAPVPSPPQRPATQYQSPQIPSQQTASSYVQKPSVGYNPTSNYQPPTQQNYQSQFNNNNYADQPPYPGCPAALLCVPDDRCNHEGKIEEQAVVLSAAEKLFRVALMACSSPKTGEVGVCCRDPNYKDPWPDMNGNNGGQQQHHHHHGDKGANNGQYNPQQGNQYSQPQPQPQQQPTNNFNSYSVPQVPPNTKITSIEKCATDEACVEKFNCHGGYVIRNFNQTEEALEMEIDIRFNVKQKICKDFDGTLFVCCKDLRKLNQEPFYTITSYSDSLADASTVDIVPVAQPNLELQVPPNQTNLFIQNTTITESKTQFSIPSTSASSASVGSTQDQNIIVERFANTIIVNDTSENDTISSTTMEKPREESSVNVSQSASPVQNDTFSQLFSADIFALPSIEPTIRAESTSTNEQVEVVKNISLTLSPPVTTKNVTRDELARNDQVVKMLATTIDNITFTNSSDTPENIQVTTVKVETVKINVSNNSSSEDVTDSSSYTESVTELMTTVEKSTNVVATQETGEQAQAQDNVVTPKTYDNIKREFFHPIYQGFDRKSDYVVSNETGEQVQIPSQYYEPPFLNPQDLLRLIFPPGNVFQDDNHTTDIGEIQFLSPLAGHSDKDGCSQGMKCLSEAYCSTMNPDEGDSDAFDIRLQFRKRSTRKKCRQPNLPVDGYCCYLREDFASMSTTPTKRTEGVKRRDDQLCGIRRPPVPDTQDGSSTTFGEFPWQALILRDDDSNCSGAIISERMIVTSATCLKNAKIDSLHIRVGEWDVDSDLETKPHQVVTPRVLLIHPGYRPWVNSNLVHDIALIVTKEKIKFDYHVSPICLPEPVDRFEDKRCVATGWSSMKLDTSGTSGTLKQVTLPIVSHGMCEMKLRKTMLEPHFKLHRTYFCAGGEPKTDSCMIQGGAPLACENSAGSYTLVGISSWKNCTQSSDLAVFSSVPIQTEWIYTMLQKNPDDFNTF